VGSDRQGGFEATRGIGHCDDRARIETRHLELDFDRRARAMTLVTHATTHALCGYEAQHQVVGVGSAGPRICLCGLAHQRAVCAFGT
jgi:hypothetical protein